jgi:RNA polymerase sigma-70 factor (ECF subfamily)
MLREKLAHRDPRPQEPAKSPLKPRLKMPRIAGLL